MRKIIAMVATAVAAVFGLTLGDSIEPVADAVPVVLETPTVEAHYVAYCPHWYIADGEYTAGMGAQCSTGAPGTYWSLIINCTDGKNYGTGWIKQGSWSYGKICPGTHVVNTHAIVFL
jgi:hypothetical protein